MFESLDLKGLQVSIFTISIFLPCVHSAFRRWQPFLYCEKNESRNYSFPKKNCVRAFAFQFSIHVKTHQNFVCPTHWLVVKCTREVTCCTNF